MGTAAATRVRPGVLGDAVAAAREAARATDGPVLVVWTANLAAAPDPVAFFAAADPAQPRLLWQQPARGFALAGAGVARAFTGEGHGRFAEAGARFAAASRRSIAAAAPGVAPAGPVALGGFAFDPERSRGVEWAGFPDGLLVVPRALLRVAGGVSALSVAVEIAPDTPVEEVTGRIGAELDRWTQAPAMVPVCVEPPPPVTRREAPPPADWMRAVARAAADVRAGRLDKLVLARSERIEVTDEIDIPATLLRMRAANPTGALFAVAQPGAAFVGASPETLVRLEDGVLLTTPLAGSIARGATAEEDARLARRLLRSAKDRHEHEVVVGAILQALDPVCSDLTPDPEAPLVLANRTVQHLATPIRGRVRGSAGVLDLVQRLHPTPAVGGYPTDAALAAIREREGFDRGWYAGPVGWVGGDGDGEFAIGIRSALVAGRSATLYAGCGIVGDSDPASEYAETRLKLRAIGAALGAA